MSSILAPDGQPARRSSPRPQAATNWWQIYEAANRSDFRGYFYVPSLEPSDQFDSCSRAVLQERSDWLYKNVGAVTMVIDGLALDEVGTGLWPKWTSSDPDYNRTITDLFHAANKDPFIFSADGQSDVYTAQYNIRRGIRLYGDMFGQLIESLPETGMPAMSFIPGYRVECDGTESPESGWRDGVRRNSRGRPIEYKVIVVDYAGQRKSITVPASEMLHFHDPFLPGEIRGVPALASVAKRLFRREDIHKALANGTLARERMGFAIEAQPTSAMAKPQNIFGGEGSVETVENPDGTKYTVQKLFGERGTDDVQIPTLPPGTKLQTIESNRPGTAVTDFLDNILREVAYSTKRPPAYVFFLAGLTQGTEVRMQLQRVKGANTHAREFQLKPQFCERWNLFFAWNRIRAGAIPGPIPRDWLKHKTVPLPDLTVDFGREGKLYADLVATNRMSISSFHGLTGEDDEDVENENLSVIERRHEKLARMNAKLEGLGLPPRTYDQTWPTSTTQGSPPANPDPQPSTDPAQQQP